MEYADFLAHKAVQDPATGLSTVPRLSERLFDFQRDIVAWALRRGRAAIFADCGLGKTPMQLEWARHIPGEVLILAPLAVSAQTVREGTKFDVPVGYARSDAQITERITITNYEMLEHFNVERFSGVVLDESSILKAYDGKTRTQIIDGFAQTPFRLACTATPAPNDYMELGNHAQFLGVMSYSEMLSMFFVHDGGETQKWRLKGHAETDFWKWLCSWAVMIRKPSDLGYDDGAFVLPELILHEHTVKVDAPSDGFLFAVEAQSLQERLRARRDTTAERVADCAAIVNDERTADNVRHEQKRIHAELSAQASGEMEALAGATSRSERAPSRALPTGRTSKNRRQETSAAMAEGEPGQAQSAEAQAVRNNTGSISRDAEKTEIEVRDLQARGHKRSELLPASGSLPQDGNCARAAVHELQSGVGQIQGCTSLTESGGGISGKAQWIVWCNLNSESEALAKAIPDAVEVQGSDSQEHKEQAIADFQSGRVRVIVSKASMFGFGLNLQCCSHMAFVGLSDSYEQYYQAVRRCWRFGQTRPVNVHIITAETEGAVVANIKRKEREALEMAASMVEHMQDLNKAALQGATERSKTEYARDLAKGENWTLHLADCVDVAREQADESVDYSVYSPPFASLYTYSNSDRDMGNCSDDEQFMAQYRFLVRDLFRLTKPGRLTSFHCMNMPTSKVRDGVIGLKDFRGELIRMHIEAGWIYHSEVCIWKDPVTAMQRTKALGLLHKQIKKDSCMSRMGIPDYVVTMRKPGDNPEPVSHTNETFPVQEWQKIASPIWTDINPSDTLQFRSAREHNDERHICPLQLDVIRRCLRLWSNPGDLVFSPFAGIGSEGYIALQMGRCFLGAELKRSYWEQACRNLGVAKTDQGTLFEDQIASA